MSIEQFNNVAPLNFEHRSVEAEVNGEGFVNIYSARMDITVSQARALRDWLTQALSEPTNRDSVVNRVMLDDAFQNACQLYAHANGSSHAIAAAAVNAASI